MSTQITTAFVNQFRAGFTLLSQQKPSRLSGLVRNEKQNGKRDFYDRISSTEVNEVLDRHGDTPLNNTAHDRRAVTLRTFDWAELIDDPDKVQLLTDPASSYIENAVAAMNRKTDALIIAAATGTAYSGVDGTTSVLWSSSTSTQQVAVDFVPRGTAANSNLTIQKLRRARKILRAAEAIDDGELVNCLITSSQEESLLETTEITNSDYNSVKALVNGEVDTFLGFKFTRTELLAKSGNNRSVLCFPMSGMVLATGIEVTTRVTERADKRYSVQPYIKMMKGASRMEELKMIEILCDETA